MPAHAVVELPKVWSGAGAVARGPQIGAQDVDHGAPALGGRPSARLAHRVVGARALELFQSGSARGVALAVLGHVVARGHASRLAAVDLVVEGVGRRGALSAHGMKQGLGAEALLIGVGFVSAKEEYRWIRKRD